MKKVGRRPDDEAGRILMQTLEASTLKRRQNWYAEALPGFVADGVITNQQAEGIRPYIGLPIDDIMHLETPYDKALRDGVITRQQAETMNGFIFERAHSSTALCSGTATYVYDAGVTNLNEGYYFTEARDDNVIKATCGAKVIMKNVAIEKRGDTTDHSEGSFTGLNAAVLAEGGSITMEDCSVISHAIGGNNVFVHGKDSSVTLKNVLLDAYGIASNRCIYVSFGGRLEAEGCEFVSRGSISSTVATDTGGGRIYLKDCLIKTLGGHCASLYSTGEIIAEHCLCMAPETEGLIIVGGNTMTLMDTCVFSGQGQGVKLTTAMESHAGTFTMIGGSLTACEGPVVSAEGKAEVTLRNVAIANPSKRAIVGVKKLVPPGIEKRGTEPSLLHVMLYEQELQGSIEADPEHTLSLELLEGSRLVGSINGGAAAHTTLHISADSRWELTGDSVVDILVNEDSTGANIVTGGYSLKIAK